MSHRGLLVTATCRRSAVVNLLGLLCTAWVLVYCSGGNDAGETLDAGGNGGGTTDAGGAGGDAATLDGGLGTSPHDPIDLGPAPVSTSGTAMSGSTLYYRVEVQPGSVYDIELTDLIDDVNLAVAKSPGSFPTGACSSAGPGKSREHCFVTVAQGTEAAYLWIAVSATAAPDPATFVLHVDEMKSQGTKGAPLKLGAPPVLEHDGSVLTDAPSWYEVPVTPGKTYWALMSKWRYSGSSQIGMGVFEPDATLSPDLSLCGGKAATASSFDYRLCGFQPTTDRVHVTVGALDPIGSKYMLSLTETSSEGTQTAPVDLAPAPMNYQGRVGIGASYYRVPVSSGTRYLIDLRRVLTDARLRVFDAAAGSLDTPLCLIDAGPSHADPFCDAVAPSTLLLIEVSQPTDGTPFVIGVHPFANGLVPPHRYPAEGGPSTPVSLGSAPVLGRYSTVDSKASYYVVTAPAGSSHKVRLYDANSDVDLYVYADKALDKRLCASTKWDLGPDECVATVPAGGALYVRVGGAWTTNGGSWGQSANATVGAAFTLGVE